MRHSFERAEASSGSQRHGVTNDCTLRERGKSVLILPLVRVFPILFVLHADVLNDVRIGNQVQRCLVGKRPRVIFWIVILDLKVEMPEIAPAVPLGDQHVLASWMPGVIQPALLFEARRLNNKSVALPFSYGNSQPRSVRIFR